MKVADILATKGSRVITGNGEASVLEAAKLLSDTQVGVVVIVDDTNRVIGTLSERDIVRGLTRRGAAVLEEPVELVMTRDVHTCDPQETVARAMAQMTRFRYRHLPVVERGELMGIISIGDLVKHRVREMEMETGVLRDRVIARS